jgi:cell division protein FtsQ
MRTAALTLTAIPRLALRLPRRVRVIALIATIAAACAAILYYAWFRDSGLVKVQDVTVTGATGPNAGQIRDTLEQAAREQTTLHVDQEELQRAVEAEPSILRVTATPDFPHGLRIDVTENHPVAAIAIPGSGNVPIAGNGTLMPGDKVDASVPEIKIQGVAKTGRSGTAAARLTDERAVPLLRVAATAPPALLHRAISIERRRGEGIVVVLKNGPRGMFGDDTALAPKWRAAAGVLASTNAQGAAYVDVRLPERPVAGGLKAQTPPGGVAAAPGPSAVAPSASTPDPTASPPSTATGGSPPNASPVQPSAPAPTQPQTAPVTPQSLAPNTQP